ncbi:carbamoyltransferase C-terminal domain-containing protein [Edaphobacter sp. DSM 109919]|uniref:Carbamoyltransferase C-terminal domain-containing protein n=1 Tax=Edaphobacter paludis TaxID=3035702 RepID=A0AAU7CYY1_9BACT
MKIIGISGLENSVPFKQANWPGLEEREYRIAQGMDAAAALVVDGRLVAAAEEERFSGKKHTGDFPIHAIRFCLAEGGMSIDDIDEIAHGFDYSPYRDLYSRDEVSASLYNQVFSREALLAQVRRDLPGFLEEKVCSVGHHLAHAASAAYTSGWGECLVVVNDAMGEIESLSVYDFHDGEFEKIRTVGANDSIGILYSLVTLHLGFDFNSDEYKIMGLAPYGDPARFRPFFEQTVQLRDDGSIRIPILKLNRSREERENYTATRAYLDEHLVPRRLPVDPVSAIHQDVAAALQECLDRVVLHVCGYFAAQTGLRRIALAGGVALNCTANGKLMSSGLFDEVYVQPVAGDDGTALGAALYRTSLAGDVPNRRLPAPLFGPRYSMSDIEAALHRFGDRIEWQYLDSLEATCASAARLIADGRVIAWYRGRMEYGPRALGNRSILADPGHPEMRDRINAMVKKREAFRPFAPACSVEEAHRWFDVAVDEEHPYMISVVDVRPEAQALLPAITHVNGSARLQTVSANDNPDFHALLLAVGETTGRQMVLNTSFNVKGQPIVNTPDEAIETFLGTGIEFLFLENCNVTRSDA